MKKILIFNYFVKKALEKEKELLGLDDDRAALLALVFSRSQVQHRHATGCCQEVAYAVNPKFLQELFILLCSNAEKSGDNLKQSFDFVGIPRFQFGYCGELQDMEDKDISYYLNNNLFPYAGRQMNKELYTKLLSDLKPEALENFFERMSSKLTYEPRVEALEQPEPCAETAMIDRAWSRLVEHNGFISMLKPEGKRDYRGWSIPYQRYAEHINNLLGREDY